jgi:hypothetical protein
VNILEFAFKVCYENGSGYPFQSVEVRYKLNELVCLIKIDSYVFTGLRKIVGQVIVAHLPTAPVKAACEVQHFS